MTTMHAVKTGTIFPTSTEKHQMSAEAARLLRGSSFGRRACHGGQEHDDGEIERPAW